MKHQMRGEPVMVARPRDGVALIEIHRSEKRNAIDARTDRAMVTALRALERDPSVGSIVLTGSGHDAFCAGADIGELLPALQSHVIAGTDDPQFCGLSHRPITEKPIIAAINGIAYGGGLEIALACDLRLAAANARFALPEITVGILAGGGGCTRLPRLIPQALAAQMILTGEPIDAARALAAGLVSEVLDDDALLPRALDIASRIAALSPGAVRECVELLRNLRYEAIAGALVRERAAFQRLITSPDAKEGIAAFVEKRTPVFFGSGTNHQSLHNL